MRFFAESASKGVGMVRDALNNAFDLANNGIIVQTDMYVNQDNFTTQFGWYESQATTTSSDAASMYFDWLDWGRKNAGTLWTEDQALFDQQAQIWSFLGDGLRSAGMLAPNYGNSPPQPGEPGAFGGYIHGLSLAGSSYLGGHPAGATYRIFALIGHGAKAICLYNYGPYPIGAWDEWSQSQNVYQPIADAIRLVGRGEKLLYPGRPRRGKVAIYLPGISNLWDRLYQTVPGEVVGPGLSYQNEVQFLHYALIHAGYTVDFVDDYDLAGGALQQRGYTTLYVTGPNVANDRNMISQPSDLVILT